MRRNERWQSVRMLCRFWTVELLSQIPESLERWGGHSRDCAAQGVASPRRREPFIFRIPRIGSLAALLIFFGALPLFAGLPVYFDPSGLLDPATNTSQVSTNRAQTAATNSMDALDDKHILAIGDRLSFRIEEDLDDPKPLVVTDSGDLEVPYIGRFPAENKTCKQLARDLKAALEKDYYYQATVVVAVDSMAKSRGRVYLVGPVREPGPQEIPSDEVFTLSKAILRAGGFTDYADRKSVKVTRQEGGAEKQTFTVDVSQILDQGKTENDLRLHPGDLIYVPERLIRF